MKFLKTSYPLTGPPLFCRICAGLHHHNSPGAEVKELFKPSKDARSIVVQITKKLESLGYLFFCG